MKINRNRATAQKRQNAMPILGINDYRIQDIFRRTLLQNKNSLSANKESFIIYF